MNKPLIIVMLILLLAACSPTPTVVPSSPIPTANGPDTNPASPVPQSNTPVTNIQPTPTFMDASGPTGTLWLQVFSPLDEAVINTAQVEVIGSAPTGTVLSINDEIILVGDDEQFKAAVSLEEGPNLIEIIASDIDGNESSLLLTVIYEP
jgi:hypothetical protein